MNLLQTYSLSIGYRKGKRLDVVQHDLNLQVSAGEMICLIGPNGCGKSTLLRTLAGLQKPISGSFKLADKELNLLNTNEKALFLAFVLTEKVEVENLSVHELVFTGRYPHTSWLGNRTAFDLQKTQEAIDMVHLSHKRDCLINELSDGEKQRAMIAKALAQDTPLIFLDEPTAHLDLPNRVEIMLLLRRLAKETNKAFILSTHELDLALQASDQIWLMNENGVETGVPEDLVLKGCIGNTFASKAVEFNPESGSFNMQYATTSNVQLSGDKTAVYWTKRALARAGYAIDSKATIQIQALNKLWVVNEKEIHSISELLAYLSKL